MHVHHHAPGSFCWFELTTTDQPQAIAFYSDLFDWRPTDFPMGPDEVYTIFRVEGRDTAAVRTMRPAQREQRVPPSWLAYISVENADAGARRALASGGTVVAPPFDVRDRGRMAVLADPTGAVFALWEPRNHHGTGIVQANGTGVWLDLNTPDPARAAKFYRDVFGWQIVAGKDMSPAKPSDYGHIVLGSDFIGGIPPASSVPNGTPAHWLIYFGVADCDKAVRKTEATGGTVLVPTVTMANTRKYAVLTDPQHAPFAVVQSLG